MSEQIITSPDLQAENEALMQQSELGVALVDAYRAAVEIDPRLAEAKIVNLDSGNKAIAFAKKKWAQWNTSGMHEVHLRLDDPGDTIAYYEKNMAERPDMVALFSEKLGVEASQFTPYHMQLFVFLHELGHVSDYMDNEDNPARYDSRIQAEKYAQPLGDVMYRDVINPQTPIHKSIVNNSDYYQKAFGTSDVQELAGIQAVAYRNMTHEAFADDFAANACRRNPQLLTPP